MNAQAGTVSVKDEVSAAEWAMRVDLAAAYRLVADYRWDDLIFTHISARVPGSDPSLSHQPLWDAVRGGDGFEPGQGRPQRP